MRMFLDGAFGRIGGKLQASPHSLAASYFFLVFLFNVLGQYQERARNGKVVVLSLVILRKHLCYACVYV